MNVAFIPVRGGSKSIPLKNIRMLAGHPLVYWTARAACECKYIDKVYVATDSIEIAECVGSFSDLEKLGKIQVISRSAASASDTASTESAMLEFSGSYDFINVVLIQATSPLLSADDLNRGFELLTLPGTDSVMSVVRQYRFNWKQNDRGYIQPTNYDVNHRPRRQEFHGYLVENGAFYITSKEAFLRSGVRVSGNIRAVEMDEESYFEIDEPADWTIIEAILKERVRKNKKAETVPIKMLLTDCDGCLTDGGMYYSEKGDELKKFNTKDGVGFQILREKGIVTGIITGEDRELNRRRAEKLNLDVYVPACKDKKEEVHRLSEQFHIPLWEIAFVGDDLNDLEAMQSVGFGACPADADERIKQCASYISEKSGGQGLIRDVAEYILNIKAINMNS